MAAATAIAVAGIGLGVASFFGGNEAAEEQARLQKMKFAEEKKIEAQKRLGMELDASRRTVQQIRNAQQARSIALNNATSQGAGQSSGLMGGYAQISGQANQGLLAIGQNLDIGRKISDSNMAISDINMSLAENAADASFWAGLGGLGKSLTGAAGLPMFQ